MQCTSSMQWRSILNTESSPKCEWFDLQTFSNRLDRIIQKSQFKERLVRESDIVTCGFQPVIIIAQDA